MAEMRAGPGPAAGTPHSGDTEGAGMSDQAREKGEQAAEQAREKGQQAVQQARGQMREQVEHRSTEAGHRVRETADDLRTVSGQLREQGKDGPAKVADQAADRVERIGSYLAESDADRILEDVEDMARRQPWAVVAGGIALGFAASRFLKASSSKRHEGREASPGMAGEQRFERRPTGTAPTAHPGPVVSPAATPPAPAPPRAPVPPEGVR